MSSDVYMHDLIARILNVLLAVAFTNMCGWIDALMAVCVDGRVRVCIDA